MRPKLAKPARDGLIADLAAEQHGLVSTGQMHGLGVGDSAIKRRVATGRLHRIHRGVYAVGHQALSNEARWMAGVLACGEGAVLSHRSAGALWGISAVSAGVDVTIHVDVGRVSRPGIRLHRSRTLSPAGTTRRSGIPVTTPTRTLEDLRRALPSRQFAAALRQAEFLGLPIGDRWRLDHTRSELEARFLTLLRRHRLPQPEVNVKLDRFVVDFLWRAQRLVIELDGWTAHRGRSSFEEDRARDTRLKLLGFQVVRFTWRQLHADRGELARTVRTLLEGA